MGRHLPGNPSLVVRHLPGAGGLTAANHAYNVAPRDGTAFVAANRTVLIEPLLGGKGAQFDALKFTWLASTNVEYTVCVSWHTAPVKTLQDAFAKDWSSEATERRARLRSLPRLRTSSPAPSSRSSAAIEASTSVAGHGTRRSRRVLRDVLVRIEAALHRMADPQKVNMLFQMALERHPDLLDVPLISDHAEDP